MPGRRWYIAGASLLILMFAVPHVWSKAGTETGRSDTTIRVGLLRSFRNAKRATVTVTSAYSVLKTGSTDKLASYTSLAPVTVQIANSSLSLAPKTGAAFSVGSSVTIAPTDPSATINIDSPGLQSRRYRGTIEITLQSSSLLVVNVLGLEDYLPGVLVGEMPSSFPEEALKSQAVAARCYTLCSRHKHESAGFNVCDSVHCQVFDGCLRETPQVAHAVAATRGQVLTYKGEIASVMYHGDCGGATQCYSDVYRQGDYPYLCGVEEPAGVPCSTWEKSYKPADLAARLLAGGVKEAAGLESVAVTKTSTSGRALEIEITGAKASTVVSGSRLRTALGAGIIKSTLFTIETATDGVITFSGKGHGHGIGMCQIGAKGLASAPFNYTYAQILDHYFPGTTLSPITAASATTTPKECPSPTARQKPLPSTKSDSTTPLAVRVLEPKL